MLRDLDRLIALAERLESVLSGTDLPKGNVERSACLEVCRLKRRYRAAAELCSLFFAADSEMAENLEAGHRFNAVQFAVLASSGKGTDAAALDVPTRAKLRRQASDWLHADRQSFMKLLASGKRDTPQRVE